MHKSTLGLRSFALIVVILLSSPLTATAYLGNSQIANHNATQSLLATTHGGFFACPTSTCSYNWAGYVDLGAKGSVSAAYGSWIVPVLSCPSKGTTFVALWVGIDGYNDGTVEQTGILGECSSGHASYSSWYEFYPNPSVTTGVGVKPGDHVRASVTYSSSTGKFTVTITDVNSKASASHTQAVSGAHRSSAEWIVETPELCSSSGCHLATLANFGKALFGPQYTGVSGTNYATIGGSTKPIGSFSHSEITMVSGSGSILAQPSSLGDSGTSFTVAYH